MSLVTSLYMSGGAKKLMTNNIELHKKRRKKMNTFQKMLFVHSSQHDSRLKALVALTKIEPSQLVEMSQKLTWQSW